MLFGRPLDVIGILKKNGIMLVDFALQGERERGLSSEDAIHEACLLRFRPTLMTTLCALLGGVPPYQRPNGLTGPGQPVTDKRSVIRHGWVETFGRWYYTDKLSRWLSRRRAGVDSTVLEPAA